jgi:hypothetical protein
MDAPRPWDQREDEGARAFECFCVYRDLGAARKICEAVRIHYSGRQCRKHVDEWARKYGWDERVRAYDQHCQKLKEEAAAAAVADEVARVEAERLEAQRERVETARLMIRRVRARLESLEPDEIPPGVLPQLLKVGADLCRLEDGEATDRTDHTGAGILIYLPDNGRDSE